MNSGSSSSQLWWTGILELLLDHGRFNEVLGCIPRLHNEGIVFERGVLLSLIHAGTGAKDLPRAKVLQGLVREAGLETDSGVGTELVRLFGKCGDLESARGVFDGLVDRRSVVSWTAIISATAESDDPPEALALLRRMQLEGVAPNRFTVLAILGCCKYPEELLLGIYVHKLCGELGEQADVVLGSALLGMFGRCSGAEKARVFFEKMAERNVVSWNMIISANAENGEHSLAASLFREMQLQGERPNKATFLSVLKACEAPSFLPLGRAVHSNVAEAGYETDQLVATSLITMYGKCGSLEEARRIFNTVPHRDSACWTAMIGSCSENGASTESLSLFRKMQQEGRRPSRVTYVQLLNACASDSSSVQAAGRVLHRRAEQTGMMEDTMVRNAVINMYGKSGDVTTAWEVFNSGAGGLVSWNSLIAAFGLFGERGESLKLFQLMQLEGVGPDGRTFMGMLDGCRYSGSVFDGCLCLSLMFECGVCVESEHWGCLVDLLGRAGWLNVAEDVEAGDELFKWMSLVGASRMHGDVPRAERAAKRVTELLKTESSASLVCVELSKVYQESGQTLTNPVK